MTNGKKLALINDISERLQAEGVSLTPNAVRARLKAAMLHLAGESVRALGADVDEDELERIAGSRAFQEAVASMLNEEDSP